MSCRHNIIATGSDGNAVIIEDLVLIDCGVPFKILKEYVPKLKLVLLTHEHSDHFNKSTIRKLAQERPTLRFGCGQWLVNDVLACGVNPSNVDILTANVMYGYGICNIIPVPMVHNVPNQGYKLHFPQGKVFYATDTNNLDNISARDYDLYLIEANYSDEEIWKRIEAKEENGEFAYERQVLNNHLSKAKCDDFLVRNMGSVSKFIYLHERKGSDFNKG